MKLFFRYVACSLFHRRRWRTVREVNTPTELRRSQCRCDKCGWHWEHWPFDGEW